MLITRITSWLAACGATLLLAAACGNSPRPDRPDARVDSSSGATQVAGHTTGPGPAESPQAGEQAEPRIFLSASWAEGYASIGQMARDSDLVAIGVVAGTDASTVDTKRAGAVTATLVFTDFRFEVEEALKGSAGTSSILIHQTGGRNGAQIVEIHDDPLLEVGARYLLFLRNVAPGKYAIKAGPVGRMLVEGDQIRSLSARYPDRGIDDFGIQGQTIAQLKEALAEALR